MNDLAQAHLQQHEDHRKNHEEAHNLSVRTMEELQNFMEHASEQLDWKSPEEIGHYVDSIKDASDSILEEMRQDDFGERSQSEMDDIIMQAASNARKRKA